MRFLMGTGLLAILILSSGVHGAVVRIEVSGTITSVDDRDRVLTGIVDVGQPYAASYVFDSLAPDALPAHPTSASYPVISGEFHLPNVSDAGANHHLHISVNSDTLYFSGFGQSWWSSLKLHPISPLSDDRTPWPFPAVANSTFFASLGKSIVEGPVSSVVVAEVPEPCSIVGLCFAGIYHFRRRQERASCATAC